MNTTHYIHPDFKIAGNRFETTKELLDFTNKNHPNTFLFLQRWFDEKQTVQIKTSGTTGVSKIINAPKKAMIKSAKATKKYFHLPEKTRVIICLSTDYIAGKMMWVRALTLGWEIKIAPHFTNPLENINDTYDFCAMTPMQFQNTYAHIDTVKKCLIGGGALQKNTCKKIQHDRLKTEVFQSYAMTETLSHIAIRKVNDDCHAPYQALENITFEKDKRGCLVVNAPDFLNEKIKTNDLINLISPTEFEWLGRADNMINSGGVKIIPEKIEQSLHHIIKKPFFIMGVPDKVLGQKTVLIIEDRKQNLHEKNEILEYLKGVIFEKHHRPKMIYFVYKFERTATGKIKRQATVKKIVSK